MPHADETNLVAALSQGFDQRIDAVTNHAEHVIDIPFEQCVHDDVCGRVRISRAAFRLAYATRRLAVSRVRRVCLGAGRACGQQAGAADRRCAQQRAALGRLRGFIGGRAHGWPAPPDAP